MRAFNPSEVFENLEAEIVVIGGGGAGLAAAVAAAEKGASVILLERRSRPGGSSALAKGFFAAESPAQKRALIDARKDELFKLAMSYAHWKIDPRVVRAFIDKSGDTVRWLEEKGLNLDFIAPLYPNQYPLTWHVPKGGWGVSTGGSQIIRTLAKNCNDLGVKLFFAAKGKKILTGTKGSVTGLLVATQKGEFVITTKSIICATGGYGGNKRLLKRYCPIYHDGMHCIGVPNRGDGLALATVIGAANEGLGVLQLVGPYVRGKAFIQVEGPKPRTVRISLAAVGLEPYTLWVNKRGVRFIDETVGSNHFESANAVARQPDTVAYILIDSKIVRNMTEQGLIVGIGRFREVQRTKLPGLENSLRSASEKDTVKMSDSWDDIANWMGADPNGLKATIGEYNAACDQGYDPVFAKDRRYLMPLRTAPYYALKGGLDFLGTIGGIKINEFMEVIDNQGNPIPGVYAAGVDAGGWTADTYCSKLAGGTFGFALNSGRIAGENAADFCVKQQDMGE